MKTVKFLVGFLLLSVMGCTTIPTKMRPHVTERKDHYLHNVSQRKFPKEIKHPQFDKTFKADPESFETAKMGEDLSVMYVYGDKESVVPMAISVAVFQSGRDLQPELENQIREYKKVYRSVYTDSNARLTTKMPVTTVSGVRVRVNYLDRSEKDARDIAVFDNSLVSDVYLYRFKSYYIRVRATTKKEQTEQLPNIIPFVEGLVSANFNPEE